MTFIFNPFRNAKEGCQGRRFQLKCGFLFDTILDTERKRMKRRDFLSVGAVAGLAAIPALGACTSPKKNCCGMPKLAVPKQPAQLNLALQWNGIPVADEVDAKLDFLEANGFQAVEIPSALKWLEQTGPKLMDSLKKRNLVLTTACGPSRFDKLDKAANDAEVARFMPILEILGEMKAVGLIICPARRDPEMGLKELRHDFVTNTGKRLAQKAAACGTSIVLEPLQRAETPFLRQVADGAQMAKEIGPGCSVMGDFWHMSKEEPSMMAAFLSAGSLLTHVHIASLKNRKYPGTDGACDCYVDGFKGLKLLGYRGAVSMEAGPPIIGRDAKNKPIYPDMKARQALIVKMVTMLREQWAEA
jgi:sugar phosphate isomerase/epimerase